MHQPPAPPPQGSPLPDDGDHDGDRDQGGSNGSRLERGEPKTTRWRRARRRPGSRPGLY